MRDLEDLPIGAGRNLLEVGDEREVVEQVRIERIGGQGRRARWHRGDLAGDLADLHAQDLLHAVPG